MEPTYAAFLRSKEKEFQKNHFQAEREFGGSGSVGSFAYRFEQVMLGTVRNDRTALTIAKREARKKNMILLKITKTIYTKRNVPA